MLKLGTVIIVMEFAVKSEWLIQHIEFMINPIEIFVLFENLASGSQQRYIMYLINADLYTLTLQKLQSLFCTVENFYYTS